VEQYTTKYMKLARFALNLIPDEKLKSKRFYDGLYLRIIKKWSWEERGDPFC
jgi:hypothetical protein